MVRTTPLTTAFGIAVMLSACGLPGQPAAPWIEPVPTWPVPAEILPEAVRDAPDASLSCLGRTFPMAGLHAADGAETAVGPEFDALRAALAKFGPEFPGSAQRTWRIAGRDATGALFLAAVDDDPTWLAIEVTAAPGLAADPAGTAWTPKQMGGCQPEVVVAAGFGPASWALDPDQPTPGPTAAELHVLVWEAACSGGAPATGRISAPVVVFGKDTVTITIGVRPRRTSGDMLVTCPGPPGTPAILRLPEPLGARTLLDGGRIPASPPAGP